MFHKNDFLETNSGFGRLYTRYIDKFITVAVTYTRDRMAAEDIVNDCFLAYWENRHRLPDNSNIPAYIMTSVKNRCLNWLEQQKVRTKIESKIQKDKYKALSIEIESLELTNPHRLFESEIVDIINMELSILPDHTQYSIFLPPPNSMENPSAKFQKN